ncbi:hypothetical protein GF406_27090 [candidate division KSB1 bacterium]|nr:hypothetical protein [candidate division KSB1 bacterium]
MLKMIYNNRLFTKKESTMKILFIVCLFGIFIWNCDQIVSPNESHDQTEENVQSQKLFDSVSDFVTLQSDSSDSTIYWPKDDGEWPPDTTKG